MLCVLRPVGACSVYTTIDRQQGDTVPSFLPVWPGSTQLLSQSPMILFRLRNSLVLGWRFQDSVRLTPLLSPVGGGAYKKPPLRMLDEELAGE